MHLARCLSLVRLDTELLQQSTKGKKAARSKGSNDRKYALELGSGPGLAGMAAALLGWHTTLTDVSDVIPLLRKNVQLNFSGREWLDSISLRERFGGAVVCPFLYGFMNWHLLYWPVFFKPPGYSATQTRN